MGIKRNSITFTLAVGVSNVENNPLEPLDTAEAEVYAAVSSPKSVEFAAVPITR